MRRFLLGLAAAGVLACPARAGDVRDDAGRPAPEVSPPLAPPTPAEGAMKIRRETHEGAPPAREEGDSDSAAQGAEAEEPRASKQVTLEDAKFNFPTIVAAFLRKSSDGGVWRYVRRDTGEQFKLKFVSVDAAQIRRVAAGKFMGPVAFRDEASGKDVELAFTVDTAGADWSVANVRFLKAQASKAR